MKTWGPTSDVLGQNLYVNDDSFMIKFYSPNTTAIGILKETEPN